MISGGGRNKRLFNFVSRFIAYAIIFEKSLIESTQHVFRLHLVIYFSSLVGRKVPKEGRPTKSLILAADVFFGNSGSRYLRFAL